MSIFGKLFGGGKNERAPTAGEAIQKLRDTEEMLIKKQDFLEKKIQQEITIAKQNGTKNKRGEWMSVMVSCSAVVGGVAGVSSHQEASWPGC